MIVEERSGQKLVVRDAGLLDEDGVGVNRSDRCADQSCGEIGMTKDDLRYRRREIRPVGEARNLDGNGHGRISCVIGIFEARRSCSWTVWSAWRSSYHGSSA